MGSSAATGSAGSSGGITAAPSGPEPAAGSIIERHSQPDNRRH
ncbi:ORFS354W [Human betaherpesvirus 5]|nr:ORFS354W [Human betaherpesvirus 5]QHX40724.1 ORFS354W [Human betaherpesvirus 5]